MIRYIVTLGAGTLAAGLVLIGASSLFLYAPNGFAR
jgi:hypothetical protein